MLNPKPGELKIESKTLSQLMGLAVFSKDKLVGELSAIETIAYSILTNSLSNCNITIPNPFDLEDSIGLNIYLKDPTQKQVKLVNGSPYISSKISIEGTITTLGKNADYSNKENLETIEKYASSYLESHISEFLYKTSAHYNADIVGFGKLIMSSYLTIDEWNNSKWLENYKNSFFTVEANTNVKAGSLFTKS